MRIGQIYENYITISEDARMVSEAIDFTANEFDLNKIVNNHRYNRDNPIVKIEMAINECG